MLRRNKKLLIYLELCIRKILMERTEMSINGLLKDREATESMRKIEKLVSGANLIIIRGNHLHANSQSWLAPMVTKLSV